MADSGPLIDVLSAILGVDDDDDKFVAAIGFDIELVGFDLGIVAFAFDRDSVVFEIDSVVFGMEHVVAKFEDD